MVLIRRGVDESSNCLALPWHAAKYPDRYSTSSLTYKYAIKFATAAKNLGENGSSRAVLYRELMRRKPLIRQKKYLYINSKIMTLRSRQYSPDELKGSCSSFPERAFLSHHSVTVHPTEHPRGKNEKFIENSIQQADEYKGAEKRQLGVNRAETTLISIRLSML